MQIFLTSLTSLAGLAGLAGLASLAGLVFFFVDFLLDFFLISERKRNQKEYRQSDFKQRF